MEGSCQSSTTCQKCEKPLQREDTTTDLLCEACFMTSEDSELTEDMTLPPAETEDMTDVEHLKQELLVAAGYCHDVTLKEIETLQLQVKENYTAGQQQVKAMTSEIRTLLDQKETELLLALDETRDKKLSGLTERKTEYTDLINDVAMLLSEESADSSSAQVILERGPPLLTSLSSPISPHTSHITSHPGLGFSSYLQPYITEAYNTCMWVSGDGVKIGEKMFVSAVGGLQPDGSFWVCRVTADTRRQECELQYISTALFEVPQTCDPLVSCSPGQLCVAPFSQDGRWYRAVVISRPSPDTARYFFLDHGGSEESPVSSLYPLPDQFRALPFQMIHVKLTTDTTINFDTREMRWGFTDYTHKKSLLANILSLCEVDEAGPVYLIHLEDHSQTEPFDVGHILITSAQLKETDSKFKSRDVRYKEKRGVASQATPIMTSSTLPPSAPEPAVTINVPTVEPTLVFSTSEENVGETAEEAAEEAAELSQTLDGNDVDRAGSQTHSPIPSGDIIAEAQTHSPIPSGDIMSETQTHSPIPSGDIISEAQTHSPIPSGDIISEAQTHSPIPSGDIISEAQTHSPMPPDDSGITTELTLSASSDTLTESTSDGSRSNHTRQHVASSDITTMTVSSSIEDETHSHIEPSPTSQLTQSPTSHDTQSPTSQLTQSPTSQVIQLPTSQSPAPESTHSQSPTSEVTSIPTPSNIPTSQPTITTHTTPITMTSSSSQNPPISQLAPLTSPPTQNTTSLESQLIPSHTNTIPPPVCPDPIPDGTSSDTIPKESISDSIPHNVQEQIINHSIPHSNHSNSIPKESDTIPQLKPLQFETEDVLLSNETPPTNDVIDQSDTNIDSIHPCVQPGARLCVEVSTDLSSDGSFWCQLLFPSKTEGAELGAGQDEMYVRLQDDLRQAAGSGRGDGEAFTPIFYHEGDVCTACFSEDDEWYRARIEKVIPGTPHMSFTVRYLDFGNSEDRQQHQLMVLGSKFKLLPPGAIHCSIATNDHPNFTQTERETFVPLTSQEGIVAEVLAVDEVNGLVNVKLLHNPTTTNSDYVDINELICSGSHHPSNLPATCKKVRRQWSSSTDLDTPTTTHVGDWASHMEDQQEDSVFLTLPGHESSRETTPSLREATPTNQSLPEPIPSGLKSINQRSRGATPTRREATPTNQNELKPIPSGLNSVKQHSRGTTPTRREATPILQETTPTNQEEIPTVEQEVTPINQETTPTIQAVSSIKSQEATPTSVKEASSLNTTYHRETTPTQQEAPPTQRDTGPTQWVPLKTTFLQRVPTVNSEPSRSTGRQARIDLSRAKHTIFSSLGAKTTSRPLRHDDTEGSSRARGRTRHLRPDQRKLYVKCPESTPDSRIRELFGRHGDVVDIELHTSDPTILYVVMDVKGAEEALVKMNNYQISPGHKLIVEKYKVHSPSPPPSLPLSTPPSVGATSNISDAVVRLFVKNVSADHNPASLKTVFSRYGEVIKMLPDPKRRNVTYVYMDAEGGAKATNNLHGKAISKNGKPLVVEFSCEPKNK